MKHIICRAATLIMFFSLIANSDCHAQTQWATLPNVGIVFPQGATPRFDDIYFISRDTGFVVSENGYPGNY